MSDFTKPEWEMIISIINKTVPLISNPEDHGLFSFVLKLRAENSESVEEFNLYIKNLLEKRMGVTSNV